MQQVSIYHSLMRTISLNPDMLYRAYLKASVNESDIVAFRSDQYLEGKKVFAGAQYTINTNLLPLEQPFAGLDIEQDIFKAFVGWAWDQIIQNEVCPRNRPAVPGTENKQ